MFNLFRFLVSVLVILAATAYSQIIYSVSFSANSLQTVNILGGDSVTYNRLNYSGLQKYTRPGYPELPKKNVKLIIPYNQSVSQIVVTGLTQTTIPLNHLVYPCQPQIPTSTEYINPGFIKPDSLVYSSNQPYAVQPAVLEREDYYDGFNHIVSIDIYPVQYFPALNYIKLNTSITITLECNTPANGFLLPSFRTLDVQDFCDRSLTGIVENPEQINICQPQKNWLCAAPPIQTTTPFYTYVIITTESFKDKFKKFIGWKLKKGMMGAVPNLIGVVTVNQIITDPLYSGGDPTSGIYDAPGAIRHYLHFAWFNNCKYVLFAGSPDSIYYRIVAPLDDNNTHKNKRPSDLYFSDLNGDYNVDGDSLYGENDGDRRDAYAELNVGRILVRDTIELAGWIDKVIEYETNPFNGDFQKVGKVLYSQSDECQGGDANTQSGEAGMLSALSYPGWNQFEHTLIEEHPHSDSISLTGPNGADIISALNNGYGWYSIHNHGDPYFYMVRCPGTHNLSPVYHGQRGGVFSFDNDRHVFFAPESNNGFDNIGDHKSTIVYSVSCDNAHFDNEEGKRCLADVFTSLPNSGGPVFIGNIRDGYVHDSASEEKDMLRKIYENQSIKNPFIHLGTAFHSLPHGPSINYFGDPEINVWTAVPTKIDSVTATGRIGLNVYLTSSEDSCSFIITSLQSSTPYYWVFRDTIRTISLRFHKFPANVTVIKSDRIPYMVTVGGTASADITLDGDYNLITDLIIPNGKTLTILPGTQINIKPGVKLIIKGQIFAQGTEEKKIQFDRFGTSGLWGGIVLDSITSAGSVLSYIEMKNGTEIQCRNGANVLIENSHIENCTNGIYVYESAIEAVNNDIINVLGSGIYGEASAWAGLTQITGNRIKKEASAPGYLHGNGLYLINGINVNAKGNDINGFTRGMYFGGGATSSFYWENGPPTPNNRISNNLFGVSVGWGGFLEGGSGSIGSMNSITGNYTNSAYVYSSSTALMDMNYWGEDNNCYIDESSYLSANDQLPTDPWGGILKSSISSNTKNEIKATNKKKINRQDIITGKELEKRGQIKEAIAHYKRMVNDDNLGLYALNAICRLSKSNPQYNTEQYLKGMSTGNGRFKLPANKLLADLALSNGNVSLAVHYRDKVIALSDNQYDIISAKLDKLFMFLNVQDDSTAAKEILSELIRMEITEDELINRINNAQWRLTGEFKQAAVQMKQLGKQKSAGIPVVFFMDQNYPNPFNPSTVIKFGLPEDASVSLKIYNTLGQEVATVIGGGLLKAGTYEYKFDANKLAAGVYIYRLEAGKHSSVKKMLFLK